MKKQTKQGGQYCAKCGSKLVWNQDYAEKYYAYNSMYISWKFNAYNSQTGERQLVGWWRCPKDHWWNKHTETKKELL